MRRIVVSIQNGLLAEALTQLFQISGEFEPYRTTVDKPNRTLDACLACEADIVRDHFYRCAIQTFFCRELT